MWKQSDSIGWFWLNVFTTLFIVVLAVEWLSEITVSPLAVLGFVIFGYFVFRVLEWGSQEDNDFCLGEDDYMFSVFFGFLI